jgi:hypothetical protein
MEKALLSDCWYNMNDTSPPADICKQEFQSTADSTHSETEDEPGSVDW